MAEAKTTIEPGAILDHLIADDLSKYLLDSDSAKELINFLHAETDIPKYYLTPAFKIITPLLIKASRKTAKWSGGVLVARGSKLLSKLPYYDRLAGSLVNLKELLKNKASDKQLLDDILRGKRPVRDYRAGKQLSNELSFQLKTLESVQGVEKAVADEFAKFAGALNPQPHLEIELLEETEQSRLHYRAQRSPFVGRESELRKLREFTDSDKLFEWWIITGAGGHGKSRLALELCQRVAGWRVGFLNPGKAKTEWHTWQPDSPTLMIVDYASGRAEDLRTMIHALKTRSVAPDWPVRLLLLERETEGQWWKDLIPSTTEGAQVEQAKYNVPLALTAMDDEHIWDLISHILEKLGADPGGRKEDILAALDKIDSDRRPLYATMAAEAAALGEQIRSWDKTKLLDYILNREITEFWEKGGVTEYDKNLVAFATMVGGLPEEKLAELPDELELPTLKAGKRQYNPERLRAVYGRDIEGIIPKLEPDPLGEYFVLERLSPTNIVKQKKVQSLSSTAWYVNPSNHRLFLTLAIQDFTDHLALSAFTAPVYFDNRARAQWSGFITNVSALAERIKIPEFFESYFEFQRDLSERFSDESVLRYLYAKTSFNRITKYGLDGQIDHAQSLYDELVTLSVRNASEPELRKEQATAALNLVVYYLMSGELNRAQSVCDGLIALSVRYSGEPTLREERAKADFNLIQWCSKAGKLDHALPVYDRLVALSEKYTSETAIRELRAQAAFHLVNGYSLAGKLDHAQSRYDELATLSERFTEELALREERAGAAFNLMNDYSKAGKLENAESLYNELVEFSEKYAWEPAIRVILVNATVNLMYNLRDGGRLDRLKSMYQVLVDLSQRYPEDEVVREQYGRGAIVLMRFCILAKRDTEAMSFAYDLERLIEGLPADSVTRTLYKEISRSISVAIDNISTEKS